jgi:ubiquinol-cytochrome c reductase cytochrome b subunit
LWHHTVPALFWPTIVLPGILFTLAGAYPFLEAKLTKDRAKHHLLQRPRDVPVRTGLGAMAITFYSVLLLSGGNDLIAKSFDISLNAMTWAGRIGMLLAPPLAYVIAYKICIGLQRHDREVLEHGIETGIIKRLPNGEFIEIHQPLGAVDDHGHGLLEYAGSPVPKKMNKLGNPQTARVKGFFRPVREKAEIEAELAALEQAEAERAASQRELTD